MDLTPEERAKLEAEWAKGNKWGAALERQKAFATVASSAVFGLILIPSLIFLSVRGAIVAIVLGVPAGMAVRRALMPKGQFGE